MSQWPRQLSTLDLCHWLMRRSPWKILFVETSLVTPRIYLIIYSLNSHAFADGDFQTLTCSILWEPSPNAVFKDCNALTDAMAREQNTNPKMHSWYSYLFQYSFSIFFFNVIFLWYGQREFGRAEPNAVGEDRNASTDAMTREQNTGPQNAFEKTSFFAMRITISSWLQIFMTVVPRQCLHYLTNEACSLQTHGWFGVWVFILFHIFLFSIDCISVSPDKDIGR